MPPSSWPGSGLRRRAWAALLWWDVIDHLATHCELPQPECLPDRCAVDDENSVRKIGFRQLTLLLVYGFVQCGPEEFDTIKSARLRMPVGDFAGKGVPVPPRVEIRSAFVLA